MFTYMYHSIRAKTFPYPVIKSQIGMSWFQIWCMIIQTRVNIITPRGLNSHKYVTELKTRNSKITSEIVIILSLFLGVLGVLVVRLQKTIPPIANPLLHFLGQTSKILLILLCRNTLLHRTQLPTFRIIRYPTSEQPD